MENRKTKRSYIRAWFILFITLLIRLKICSSSSSSLKSVYQFHWFLSLISLCLVGPILEEIIFRYLVFRIFDKNTWTPYLISFFSFVLWHWHFDKFPSLERLFWLFACYGSASVVFSFIYKESNWNLFFPILLHCLMNLVALLFKIKVSYN